MITVQMRQWRETLLLTHHPTILEIRRISSLVETEQYNPHEVQQRYFPSSSSTKSNFTPNLPTSGRPPSYASSPHHQNPHHTHHTHRPSMPLLLCQSGITRRPLRPHPLPPPPPPRMPNPPQQPHQPRPPHKPAPPLEPHSQALEALPQKEEEEHDLDTSSVSETGTLTFSDTRHKSTKTSTC